MLPCGKSQALIFCLCGMRWHREKLLTCWCRGLVEKSLKWRRASTTDRNAKKDRSGWKKSPKHTTNRKGWMEISVLESIFFSKGMKHFRHRYVGPGTIWVSIVESWKEASQIKAWHVIFWGIKPYRYLENYWHRTWLKAAKLPCVRLKISTNDIWVYRCYKRWASVTVTISSGFHQEYALTSKE